MGNQTFADRGVFHINEQWATSIRYEAVMSQNGEEVESVTLRFMNARSSVATVKQISKEEAVGLIGLENIEQIEKEAKENQAGTEAAVKGTLKGESLVKGRGYTPNFTPENVVLAGIHHDIEEELDQEEGTTASRQAQAKQRQNEMQRRQVNAQLEKSEGDLSDRDPSAEKDLQPKSEEQLAGKVPANVENDFLHVGDNFYFKDESPAFTDQKNSIRAQAMHHKVVSAIVDIAQARGWDSITVRGSTEFKKAVWEEARLRGLEVAGYKPTELDKARLAEKLARRPQAQTEHENVVSKGIERGQTYEHDPSPPSPETSSEKPLRRYSGELIAHGKANYNFDEREDPSYYVKIKTEKGVEVVWGADLPRALDEAGGQIGEPITLDFMGKKPVTVKAKERDEAGKVVGEKEITTHRNTWNIRRAEQFMTRPAAEVVAQHPDLASSAGAVAAAEAAAREGKIVTSDGKPVSKETAERFVEATRSTVAKAIEKGAPIQGVKVQAEEREQVRNEPSKEQRAPREKKQEHETDQSR